MSRPSEGPFVGALLRRAWQGVRRHIEVAVANEGYDDLNPAHISLFQHPTLEGMRPSELAEALLISKQSVNDLLRGLERGGYITLAVSPEDRRSRLIRLTRKGMRLEDTVRLAARDAERRLVQELGRKRFLDFREALGETAEILNETARP